MKTLHLHTTEQKSIQSEETGWLLRRHFGFIGDDCENVVETGKVKRYYNQPILLDNIIAQLEDIRDRGNNFVSINFHRDHEEYVFKPLHIAKSTEEQIQKYNEEALSDKERDDKIKALEKEIQALKNQ